MTVLHRAFVRFWSAIRRHLVTAAAFALLSWAGFAVWFPLGLVISAVSLLVLDRKVELDR